MKVPYEFTEEHDFDALLTYLDEICIEIERIDVDAGAGEGWLDEEESRPCYIHCLRAKQFVLSLLSSSSTDELELTFQKLVRSRGDVAVFLVRFIKS